MDSRTLEAKQHASAEASTVAVFSIPMIPQDIIHEILYHIVPDPNFRLALRACSLVSKLWIAPSQWHLFHTLSFTGRDMFKWLKVFPIPEQTPAHHVRDLCLSLGGLHDAPDDFFRRIRWFAGVRKLTVLGKDMELRKRRRYMPSVACSPFNHLTATVLQIRDVMAQLQNLNDLALSGTLGAVDRSNLQKIRTGLRGDFRGQLRLLKMPADDLGDIINMLLEILNGLQFPEVEIHSVNGCLLPSASLAEACGGTLTKLSYTVENHDGPDALDHSFNFSRSPNLKEVKFAVDWRGGSLLWIPVALSTLKPTTSPRLSIVRLSLRSMARYVNPRDWWERLCDDLRRVEGEIARIKHEFAGEVNLIVSRPPWFRDSLPLNFDADGQQLFTSPPAARVPGVILLGTTPVEYLNALHVTWGIPILHGETRDLSQEPVVQERLHASHLQDHGRKPHVVFVDRFGTGVPFIPLVPPYPTPLLLDQMAKLGAYSQFAGVLKLLSELNSAVVAGIWPKDWIPRWRRASDVDLNRICSAIQHGCMGLPRELVDHIVGLLRDDFRALTAYSSTQCKAMSTSNLPFIHAMLRLTRRNDGGSILNRRESNKLRRNSGHHEFRFLSHMGKHRFSRYT
ncbi:hypothetical protein BJ322DRAFT_1220464 [Thelephora terrestris]|uniref:F-box domain-containing protein n=1 Tax=Thelephora terrestris TaxID=56493 RepID=A0A9P6L3Y7_9AGAM|nr:hypothetical protein BJ322DRAFT_1220464 [Thelephora terrestris]